MNHPIDENWFRNLMVFVEQIEYYRTWCRKHGQYGHYHDALAALRMYLKIE